LINIKAVYDSMVNGVKEDLLERKGLEVRIPIKKLLKLPHTALLFEIIKDYGFGEKQVNDITRLLHGESGKFVENALYQVIRHGNWLVIAPKFAKREMIAIEKGESHVSFEGGGIEISPHEKRPKSIDPSPQVAQLDSRHIEFPLLLRKWKQGDYFYPFGMRKKKKLARFFIDQKLSKNRKEEVWVLESNKKIIWVVGMRIDDRFRITDATRSSLVITYQNQVAR
jgi:tRNA(Ile)-lysidine synthase